MKKTGIELIAEERREQIEKHGWSLEHDKSHTDGQLIQAAQFCQEQATGCAIEDCRWPEGWTKCFEDKIRNKTRIGKLVCAGAFYMAENDRLNTEEYQDEINDIAAEIDRLQATGEEVSKKYLFDINRRDLYEYGKPELKERTKKRLTEIAECGMEEVMTAEFGYKGVTSGLFIEYVWHYSDEKFNDYMDWAKGLIKKNKK